MLSRYFGFNIKITEDVLDYEDIDLDNFMFKSKSKVSNAKLIGRYND